MTIPKTLREKLGDDGVDDLIAVISEVSLSSRNDLTTKDDLKAMRQEMASKTDLDNLKLELKAEIEKSKLESIKWMLAFWASQIGIMIAALKFFVK
ncbi:MAG: hypothetical protein L7F77_13555 [Candidatus Magnetominusculus sp. LBB02]|nr:hypothetical protein [Candidatus Magnetominusculus sp. LBB02]